jgi:hypothetical protein
MLRTVCQIYLANGALRGWRNQVIDGISPKYAHPCTSGRNFFLLRVCSGAPVNTYIRMTTLGGISRLHKGVPFPAPAILVISSTNLCWHAAWCLRYPLTTSKHHRCDEDVITADFLNNFTRQVGDFPRYRSWLTCKKVIFTLKRRLVRPRPPHTILICERVSQIQYGINADVFPQFSWLKGHCSGCGRGCCLEKKQFAQVQHFDVENTRSSTHLVSQPTACPPNSLHTSQTRPRQAFSPTFLGKRVTVADV